MNMIETFYYTNENTIRSVLDIFTIVMMSFSVLQCISWFFNTSFHRRQFVNGFGSLINMTNVFVLCGLLIVLIIPDETFDIRVRLYLVVYGTVLATILAFVIVITLQMLWDYIINLRQSIISKRQ